MIVSILGTTSAPCCWCCQKKDDAVEAQFKDGLKGAFCKKHFWEAFSARAEQGVVAPDRLSSAKGS
jgi:hypothetical protein